VDPNNIDLFSSANLRYHRGLTITIIFPLTCKKKHFFGNSRSGKRNNPFHADLPMFLAFGEANYLISELCRPLNSRPDKYNKV
jgi:hypothetical protein